jgi:hypothetical protein
MKMTTNLRKGRQNVPYDPDYQRRYRARQDPEKRRQYARDYYLAHRPKMLAKNRRYQAWRKILAHAASTWMA